MKSKILAWCLGLGLLTLLAGGLARLFELRQAGGDLYPAYSSLRADPRGLKALFLALEDLGLETRRNFRPWHWLEAAPNATWFMVGVPRAQFQEDWPAYGATLETLAREGGRLVIAFAGETTPAEVDWQRIGRKILSAQSQESTSSMDLENRWEFQLAYHDLPSHDHESHRPATATRMNAPLDWPPALSWRSALGFTNVSSAWRVLYAVQNQPVIMERPWGRGSLVLLSDSFLLTNEALRFERASPLLAWMVGPSTTVIFNETHLGVVEEPGMGALLRQYRLQGVAAVLLLLALLYIWQNSIPLAPSPLSPSEARAVAIMGRDAQSGLVQLLRRGLPPRRLLRVCLEHWKDTAGKKASPQVLSSMEVLVSEFEQMPVHLADPVKVYTQLTQLAADKRRRPAASKSSAVP